MKKILLCAAILLCASAPSMAYNVQAPNSWDSAGKGSWEYKAVYRMVEEGRSPSYKADYFQYGDTLTRYELGKVIVDLLENGKGLTDEEEEELERMKKSYRRELDALGWEEPRDERTPILEISGDLRLRHTGGDDGGNDARARMGFTYHVGDRTAIHAGGEAKTGD